jgi:hypothetical protein
VVGFLFTRLVFFLARNATPKKNWFFKRSQFLTAIALAISHGMNDAQKTMGMITCIGLLPYLLPDGLLQFVRAVNQFQIDVLNCVIFQKADALPDLDFSAIAPVQLQINCRGLQVCVN